MDDSGTIYATDEVPSEEDVQRLKDWGDEIERLQRLADQKSGDPHLDAMNAEVVKAKVRELLA